jgi:predicted polyphosphate/ATP-dependent NAD kinase
MNGDSKMSQTNFTFGLVLNPLAGLGGPAGLKGSDDLSTAEIAAARGVQAKAADRLRSVLSGLAELIKQDRIGRVKFLCASGKMGGDLCSEFSDSFDIELVYQSPKSTQAQDTRSAALEIIKQSIDMLLFVGGDGTARDIYSVVGENQCVLGIPAGVKMHSGVFAVTPKAVVSVIESMAQHRLVAARMAEVRDIDEAAFAQGKVKTQHYGEMLIPDDQLLVQSVKCSGMLDDEIMLDELCSFMSEELEEETLYILGSGGTLRHLKSTLGIEEPTLLGVDVCYFDGLCIELVARDAHEQQIFELMQSYENSKIVLSIIGGQGIVLGRGNQQISPLVIMQAGLDNLQFISTQEKIRALDGKPLRVDSGNDELDRKLAGFHKIICGYDDAILYEIGYL